MTWLTEVIADSAWGAWLQNNASGNLLDSSGNSRALAVTGSPTRSHQPTAATCTGVQWSANLTTYAATSVNITSTTAATFTALVYIPSDPGGVATVLGVGTGVNGTSGNNAALGVNSENQPRFEVYDYSTSTFRLITGVEPLHAGWNFLVGRIGGGTMDLRVNKVAVASGAYGGASTIDARPVWVHGGTNNTGEAMTTGPAAFFTSRLSDSRVDAHYDALVADYGVSTPTPPSAYASPADLGSKLRAWYSPQWEQANGGFADGAAAPSTLTNLQGNTTANGTKTGTVVMKTTGGESGDAAFECSPGGYWTLGNFMSGTMTSGGEIHAKAKGEGGTSANRSWWDFGTDGSDNAWPYNFDALDDWGRSSRYYATFAGADFTSWQRASRIATAGKLKHQRNGAPYVELGAGTVVWPTAPRLGCVASGYPTGNVRFGGIVITDPLTSVERYRLTAWLDANPSGGTTATGITISAPTATATAQAHAPTISFQRSLTIDPPTATATATAHAPTISFSSVSNLTIEPPTATATATAHAPTISFQRDLTIAVPTATATATAHAPTLSFGDPDAIFEDTPVHIETDLVGTDPVDEEDWDAEWHPTLTIDPPLQPGLWAAWDKAFVLDESGAKTELSAPRARDVILIDDTDVTFVNGKRTHVPDFQRTKPFSFGPGSVTVTGLNFMFQSVADVTWLRKWAKVVVVRVDENDDVVAVDWRGRVTSIDVSGADVTLELGGMFSAPASVAWRGKFPIRRREDITYWIHAMLRKNRQPDDYDAEDPFGVTLLTPPQGHYWNCALDTIAQGVKSNGDAITYWYDEDAHRWAHGAVDRETIHGTVYADHGQMRLEVSQDFSADVNQVFASGYDEQGGKIAFYVAPGMSEYPPELQTYPFAGGEAFGFGTLDEETTTGFGVSLLLQRLIELGYLKRDEKAGGYDADVEDAILAARFKANQLSVPDQGAVDPDLWDWLFDVDASGLTMKETRQEPAYEDPRLGKYLFTASGQLKGLNPDYDPSILPVSDTIDFNVQSSKQQMARRAARLVEDGPNWVGSLTTDHGFIAGEHNPGDPFDASMIRSNRDWREGMNVWVPNFDGGTLFHISGIDVSDTGFTTRLMLDTRARDTMTISAILDRQAEVRHSPAKVFWQRTRSQFTNDGIGHLAEIGGKLGRDYVLTGGSWNVIQPGIPLGNYGLVQRFRTRVRELLETETDIFEGTNPFASNDGVEHYVRIFGEKVTDAWMNLREGDPSVDGAWQDYRAAVSDYKSRGLLAAYGATEEGDSPCGYGDDYKGDDGAVLSGNYFDDSGFPFRAPDCRAYVAIWVPAAAVQLAGWMFRWQTDDGV